MIGLSSVNSLISNISVPITFNFPPRCKCAATLTNLVMVSLDCKPKLILKIFDGLIVDDINEIIPLSAQIKKCSSISMTI